MLSRVAASISPMCRHSGVFSTAVRTMATAQPAILNRDMGKNQWYVHLSRTEGADVGTIKSALGDLRKACAAQDVNLVVAFGPGMIGDVSDDVPEAFAPYPGFATSDDSGRKAVATQEELLIWLNHDDKDKVWKAQYDFVKAVGGHMKVARQTPTFIYGDSLDMTGFTDGTGNPEAERDVEVAIIPDGQPGEGGSHIIAQRWVHDLDKWAGLSVPEQEGVFGRTKEGSERLAKQPAHSHLSHTELREGATGDDSTPKRDEMSRRSTPYAFHDGTVGLYFMGFCNRQAPLRERMEAMYGENGQVPDALTSYSQPASGAFYFAPAVEVLDKF